MKAEEKVVPEDHDLAESYRVAVPAAQKLIETLVEIPPIGSGCEKLVYDYREGQVVAFLPIDESGEYVKRVKETYYRAKLMHLLFPENIPDAHLAGSQPPMIIFDKAVGEKNLRKEIKGKHRLMMELRGAGVAIDTNDENYFYDGEGNVSYVDGFWFDSVPKLKEAIMALEPTERMRAIRYLARINPTRKGWVIVHDESKLRYIPG